MSVLDILKAFYGTPENTGGDNGSNDTSGKTNETNTSSLLRTMVNNIVASQNAGQGDQAVAQASGTQANGQNTGTKTEQPTTVDEDDKKTKSPDEEPDKKGGNKKPQQGGYIENPLDPYGVTSSIMIPENWAANQEAIAAAEAAEREANKFNPYVSPFEQTAGQVVDASNLAMPSGRQMESMTPEQQNRWAIDNAINLADTMLTVMPVGEMLGGGIKAAKAASRAAKIGEDVAKGAKAGEAAANEIAKSGEKAAAGKLGKKADEQFGYKVSKAYDEASDKVRDEAYQQYLTERTLNPDGDPRALFYEALDRAKYYDNAIKNASPEAQEAYTSFLRNVGNGEKNPEKWARENMSYGAKRGALEAAEQSIKDNAPGLWNMAPEAMQSIQSSLGPVFGLFHNNLRLGDEDINGYTPGRITPEQWNEFIGTDEGQKFMKDNPDVTKALQDKGYNATYVNPETGESAEMIYGMTPEDWGKQSQRDQFVKSLEGDENLRKYYQDTYGDDLTGEYGYEWFRDIGDRGDYQYKHNLVRDLFGYNRDESGNSQYGINGWGNLAAGSIEGLRDMDDEAAIQAIMDYMWGADNIIDPYRYLQDANYKQSHSLGEMYTAAMMGDYLAQHYIDGDNANILGQFTDQNGNPLYGGLDNKDIGNYIMAGELLGQNLSGFNEEDLDRLTSVLGRAGDQSKFSFTDNPDEAYKFGQKYGGKRSNKNYSASELMNTLAAQAANKGSGLNYYNGVGNEQDWLIDADLADDLMLAIENQTGKKITRS